MILKNFLFVFDFKLQAISIAFCLTFCVCDNMDLESTAFDDIDPIFDTSIEELNLCFFW